VVLAIGITEAITDFIGNEGIYAVFGLMLIDAVLPAASELVMVYAGALAAGAFPGAEVTLFGTTVESTTTAFVVMALAGAIGYWIGALIGWLIGWGVGRPALERYGKYVHLGPERLAHADRWFEKYGDGAVFLGRVLPVARSFVSIPAGAMKQRLWPYTWTTLLGSTIWAFAFAGIGFGVGSSWESFHENFRYADIAILVIGAAIVAAFVSRYLVRRRRAEGGADAAS